MPPIERTVPVAVIGAGTMGAGIAQVAAAAGHNVRIFDVVPGAAERAVQRVRERLVRDADKGRISAQEAEETGNRLSAVGAIDELTGSGLAIEAVVEDLATKQDLFQSLEHMCRDDAILATNTSSLSVTAIGAVLLRPGRLVGMHFFNPAPVLPLVEVVSGAASDPTVVETVVDTARAWGKTPVRCTSTPGFIVNRVARPFYGEAMRLLEERAADVATIDAVLREAARFRMGPFELADLIGQDVNFAVSRSVWEQTFQDPRYQPSLVQQRLVDAGWLGRKSGRGFFTYGQGAGQPRPRTESERRVPKWVTYTGGLHVMKPLLDRLSAAGVEVLTERPTEPELSEGPEIYGLRLPSGGWLVESNGLAATELAAVTAPHQPGTERPGYVVLDWALDPARTTRFAVSVAPGSPDAVVDEAIGLLQSTGASVSVIEDVAGHLVARTMAMLVNEAIDLVYRGEATPEDVDTAMRLGVNYPFGPYTWGAEHAIDVLEVIEALAAAYPSGRYRPSPLLRRLAYGLSHEMETG